MKLIVCAICDRTGSSLYQYESVWGDQYGIYWAERLGQYLHISCVTHGMRIAEEATGINFDPLERILDFETGRKEYDNVAKRHYYKRHRGAT